MIVEELPETPVRFCAKSFDTNRPYIASVPIQVSVEPDFAPN